MRKYKLLAISIIIPTFNEEKIIQQNLTNILSQVKEKDEVIVVDGDSCDRTQELIRQTSARLICSARGRAIQLNVGAKHAAGEILFFLHADTIVEKDALNKIREAVQKKNFIGGCLSQEILNEKFYYKWIAFSGNVRAKLFKIFYGDQGIFVKKEIFAQVNGFDETLLFEDVIFSKKLRQVGPTIVLKEKIFTSSRCWDNYGIIKTSLRNWFITFLFMFKISPNWMKKFYPDIR